MVRRQSSVVIPKAKYRGKNVTRLGAWAGVVWGGFAGGLGTLPFPSRVGCTQTVNTVEAIWMKSPSEVEDEKYDEFYQFIAKAFDNPLAKVHNI